MGIASVGAALGVMGAASLSRARTGTQVEAAPDMSSRQVSIPVGKAGFVGATNDTMVMGEDLVKVVMWYDNEWGYSQRVIDLTAIVAAKLPVAALSEDHSHWQPRDHRFEHFFTSIDDEVL